MDVGIEYIWGERKAEDGQSELDRLQTFVKYSF